MVRLGLALPFRRFVICSFVLFRLRPGPVGLLGYEATVSRDYPVMFGTLYIFTLIGLLLNIVSDISYTLVDPRIDFEGR